MKKFWNNLFNNPGRQIKIIAKCFFFVAVIAAIIGAIVYGVDVSYRFEFEDILICIGIVIGGACAGYLIMLPVYAIGDAVENLSCLKELKESEKMTNPSL